MPDFRRAFVPGGSFFFTLVTNRPLFEGTTGQPGDDGGFRQASSALTPAMLGAMNALGASDPLTADEERERLRAGWDAN